jgi:hypothetical protein
VYRSRERVVAYGGGKGGVASGVAAPGVQEEKGDTVYSALRRIFRQRLVDFFRIPEHELPHPCNPTRLSVPQATPRIAPESTCSAESSQCNGQTAVMSHSFMRRFSRGDSGQFRKHCESSGES